MFLAKWVGVTQSTACLLGYAVREMMDPSSEGQPAFSGTVELNEIGFSWDHHFPKKK